MSLFYACGFAFLFAFNILQAHKPPFSPHQENSLSSDNLKTVQQFVAKLPCSVVYSEKTGFPKLLSLQRQFFSDNFAHLCLSFLISWKIASGFH